MSTPEQHNGFFTRLGNVLRHLWLGGPAAARRALPDAALHALQAQVTASEQQHSGEIRVCIEGALPPSYLWRHLRQALPQRIVVQQRALMMFGKLRVWDTEHNNGVLIYLNLAAHDIELLADRGLARHVPPERWQAVVQQLGSAWRQGQHAQGLAQAVAAVHAELQQHFALCPHTPPEANPNELPDHPVLR